MIRLSVFMPVFNGARFLPQAIESLLGQTFRDFELVVVDDGSADDTAEVAAAWAARDSRVRLVRHATNLGLSAARNTGWRVADPGAPYVMNHDGDNLSDPQKLERLVSALTEGRRGRRQGVSAGASTQTAASWDGPRSNGARG